MKLNWSMLFRNVNLFCFRPEKTAVCTTDKGNKGPTLMVQTLEMESVCRYDFDGYIPFVYSRHS